MRLLNTIQIKEVAGGCSDEIYEPPYKAPKGVSSTCWTITWLAGEFNEMGNVSDEVLTEINFAVCSLKEQDLMLKWAQKHNLM